MNLYQIKDFGTMIMDPLRTDAHLRALQQRVSPGCTVLDLGTGTGIWAMFAVKAGARKVYAIDPDPAIEVAQQLARDNGLADHIEFIRGRSDQIELPERVDGMVSDLRGSLPFGCGHFHAIQDARQRFLRPGAWQIPLKDKLWACLVQNEPMYAMVVEPWRQKGLGLDLTGGLRWVLQEGRHYWRSSDEIVGAPQCLGDVDYQTIEGQVFRCEATWTSKESLSADGAVLWFDAVLADGVGYTTSPWHPPEERAQIYPSTFLPFSEAVRVAPGDTVTLRYQARESLDKPAQCSWECLRQAPAGKLIRVCHSPLPAHEAEASSPLESCRPELNRAGKELHFLLSAMEEEMSLGDMARGLMKLYPDHCRDYNVTLNRVADVIRAYRS